MVIATTQVVTTVVRFPYNLNTFGQFQSIPVCLISLTLKRSAFGGNVAEYFPDNARFLHILTMVMRGILTTWMIQSEISECPWFITWREKEREEESEIRKR